MEQILLPNFIAIGAPGQARFGFPGGYPAKGTTMHACMLRECRIWTFSWEKERREKASAMKAIFNFVLVLQLVNYPNSHHGKKTCYKKKISLSISSYFCKVEFNEILQPKLTLCCKASQSIKRFGARMN